MADRILVMREGRLVGELGHDEATEDRVMELAAMGDRGRPGMSVTATGTRARADPARSRRADATAAGDSREVSLALVIYLAVIVASILYPTSFFSAANLRVVLNNLAVEGILALGMMMLMIGGVFDLSVGSLMSLVGVVSGWLMIGRGWPVGASVAVGVLARDAGRLRERAAGGPRPRERADRDAGDPGHLPGRGHPDRRPQHREPARRIHEAGPVGAARPAGAGLAAPGPRWSSRTSGSVTPD